MVHEVGREPIRLFTRVNVIFRNQPHHGPLAKLLCNISGSHTRTQLREHTDRLGLKLQVHDVTCGIGKGARQPPLTLAALPFFTKTPDLIHKSRVSSWELTRLECVMSALRRRGV